jgi:hypothetical protein
MVPRYRPAATLSKPVKSRPAKQRKSDWEIVRLKAETYRVEFNKVLVVQHDPQQPKYAHAYIRRYS